MEEQSERIREEKPHLMQDRKVVIHVCSGEVIKGYVDASEDVDPVTLFEDSQDVSFQVITVRTVGTKTALEIPLGNIKAVFFVKSFRGEPSRKDLRFYSNGPEVGKIWAEIRFKDNEVLEGLIENSVSHLVGDGFVVRPTDIGSNNLLVYISKAAVDSFRVLGVRASKEFAS